MYLIREGIKDNIDVHQELDSYLQSFLNLVDYRRSETKVPAPVDYGFDLTYQDKYDPKSFYSITMYDHFFNIKFVKRVETKSTSLADSRKAYQTTSARMVQHKKFSLNKEYTLDEISKCKKDIEKYFSKLG